MEAYLAYQACGQNANAATREMFDYIRRHRPINPKDPEKVQSASKFLQKTAAKLVRFSNNLKKNRFRVDEDVLEQPFMEAEGNPILNTQSTLASMGDDSDVTSQDLVSIPSQGSVVALPTPKTEKARKQKDRPLDPTVPRRTRYDWTAHKFRIFKEWCDELRCSVADLCGFFIHLAYSKKDQQARQTRLGPLLKAALSRGARGFTS